MTGFDLRPPAGAAVRGVEVVLVRGVDRSGNNSDQIRDSSIRLVVDGGVVGAEHATTGAWPDATTDVVYGAPDDAWGAALDGAVVASSGFGVAIAVVGEGIDNGHADARVDAVELRVWVDVGADCDDDAGTTYASRAAFVDVDGDGYAPDGETTLCIDDALPPGTRQTSAGVDCWDGNVAARPGQTAYFTTDRGDGAFDYDCDDAGTKQAVVADTGCMCAAFACTSSASALATPIGACGQTGSFDRCGGDCDAGTCALGTASTTVACR